MQTATMIRGFVVKKVRENQVDVVIHDVLHSDYRAGLNTHFIPYALNQEHWTMAREMAERQIVNCRLYGEVPLANVIITMVGMHWKNAAFHVVNDGMLNMNFVRQLFRIHHILVAFCTTRPQTLVQINKLVDNFATDETSRVHTPDLGQFLPLLLACKHSCHTKSNMWKLILDEQERRNMKRMGEGNVTWDAGKIGYKMTALFIRYYYDVGRFPKDTNAVQASLRRLATNNSLPPDNILDNFAKTVQAIRNLKSKDEWEKCVQT